MRSDPEAQVPYNFERILYFLSEGDHELVKDLMGRMAQTGPARLSRNDLTRLGSQCRASKHTSRGRSPAVAAG
eukprot:732582-Hanusia_phi.AAC.1